MATNQASNGQRVSSSSSLRMLVKAWKPISGRNRPKASRPASAASLTARATSTCGFDGGASAATFFIRASRLDLFDFRAAQNALRQEDQRDGEDREGGNVLVVDGEIGRPQSLDEPDQQAAEHGA